MNLDSKIAVSFNGTKKALPSLMFLLLYWLPSSHHIFSSRMFKSKKEQCQQ